MPCRHIAALLLALVFVLTAPPHPARAQQADGLDQPLLAANMCGPGDGSETMFTLAATGDTFPHENIQAVGETQGYDTLFSSVRPFLQAADIAYTNFDGAMLAGAGYSGYPSFNYNPALAAALKAAGIGLVSTANNHILDRGPQGLDATLDVLGANGILHHGAVRSDASTRPAYLKVTLNRGAVALTIGFLSATWGTNGIADPQNQVSLLYQSNSYGEQGGLRQSVLDAVAQAAAETDLVVVAAHWGYEYEFYPHPSQIEAAHRLAAAGADVILGAQPHTLQPVDLIDSAGRKTLVIYSLANFLASQGAYQAQAYSATSVIFYLGLARSADGAVRVTGYRYLPTIHVDSDTRPAPIQPNTNDDALAHVRMIMRDPGGARQVAVDAPAPGSRIEVCPSLTLAEAPATPLRGDFAQHYATLGSTAPRPLTDGINALGLPLAAPRMELAGDCVTTLPVLYTERQRLELHAAEPWPYRVAGSQLGAVAFAQHYPGVAAERRSNLAAADTFADSRFRAFYDQYGGLAVFGYPISGGLNETPVTSGLPTTVQYFERARFELVPGAAPTAPLSEQVRLSLLGRELLTAGGVKALCQATPASPLLNGNPLVRVSTTAAQVATSAAEWLPILAMLALAAAIIALAAFAVTDWQSYRRRGTRHGYRHRRRSAYERFAPAQSDLPPDERYVPPPAAVVAPPSPPVRRPPPNDDDDFLKQLLDQ